MQTQKRINVDIDDKLMQAAMHLSGLTTKKAVVEAALKLLIQINQINQQGEIRKLRGDIRWEGNLDESCLERINTRALRLF